MIAFDIIVGQVLTNEGGLVDDPDDPGGLTNFGISQRSYPNVDIRNLTVEGAKDIYRTDFYNHMNLSALDSADLQYYLLDMGVNHGPETAIHYAQKVAGVNQDGVLGPNTAHTINSFDAHGLLIELIEERVKLYVRLTVNRPVDLKYLVRWINRAFITL